MDEIIADPGERVSTRRSRGPELGQDRDTQAAILDATIAVWQAAGRGVRPLGAIDRDGWQDSIDFMTELGLVPNPVTVDDLVSEEFLSGS